MKIIKWESKKEKVITIYTILMYLISIMVFEIGYCNTTWLKSIITKGEANYKFSFCRIIMYILFLIFYWIFKNEFVKEAIETTKNKYKRIFIYLLTSINFMCIIVAIISIFKFEVLYLRAVAIGLITASLGTVFTIYISNNLIKNAIVISSTFGIVFTFTTSYNHAIDEKKHFMSAFNLSFFNFKYVDKPITDMQIEEFPQLSKFTTIDNFFDKYTPNITGEVNMEDTPSTPASYTALVYALPAMGIAIARLLGGSIIDMYIIGRIINLILYTILVCIAIKIIPYKKNIFFIIAFMPYMLLLASSYSIDGICLGTVYIFIAYCLKIYKENEIIKLKQFLILAGLFAIMLIGKGVGYIFVATLVFMLPLYNTIKNNKRYIPIISICGIICIAMGILFFIYVKNTHITSNGDSRGESGINATEQLNFLTEHPGHDLKLAINHIKTTLLSFDWYANLYPSLFFTENSIFVFFTMMLFVLYVAIIEDDYNFKIKYKMILMITFLLTFGMTSIILYLTFTPVGATHVDGYQARYIFPILPLILFCISNNKVKSIRDTNRNMNIAVIEGVFLGVGILQLILV